MPDRENYAGGYDPGQLSTMPIWITLTAISSRTLSRIMGSPRLCIRRQVPMCPGNGTPWASASHLLPWERRHPWMIQGLEQELGIGIEGMAGEYLKPHSMTA